MGDLETRYPSIETGVPPSTLGRLNTAPKTPLHPRWDKNVERTTRGTAGHAGGCEVRLTSPKGPYWPEHCGHDSVGAVTADEDGVSNAHKRKGKALDSEYPSVGKESGGNTGTVYMCRVMYGALNDANVYLYRLELENTVSTYNGTTENHWASKDVSEENGHMPCSSIDLEASANSTEHTCLINVRLSSEVA